VTLTAKTKTQFTKIQELVYELKVRDAMSPRVITAASGTFMSELREILRSNSISGTPIVSGDKIVGIVSIEDFIKWLSDGGNDCPIGDRMSTNVETLNADDPLTHAIDRLDQTGFGRFPVIERKDHKLVGIITKGDIISKLLQELEVDYQEEEIHRYRASHIFEDIIADNTTLTFRSYVKGKDFEKAGEVSSGLKKTLERLGVSPAIVRRAAIASYEAEMNLVIYTDGGDVTATVQVDRLQIDVTDAGPGIADIEKAMTPGYSTASDWVRELGFGAGMGLVNIQRCADKLTVESTVGKGTHLTIMIDLRAA